MALGSMTQPSIFVVLATSMCPNGSLVNGTTLVPCVPAGITTAAPPPLGWQTNLGCPIPEASNIKRVKQPVSGSINVPTWDIRCPRSRPGIRNHVKELSPPQPGLPLDTGLPYTPPI